MTRKRQRFSLNSPAPAAPTSRRVSTKRKSSTATAKNTRTSLATKNNLPKRSVQMLVDVAPELEEMRKHFMRVDSATLAIEATRNDDDDETAKSLVDASRPGDNDDDALKQVIRIGPLSPPTRRNYLIQMFPDCVTEYLDYCSALHGVLTPMKMHDFVEQRVNDPATKYSPRLPSYDSPASKRRRVATVSLDDDWD
eukprot:gnl/Spiro4/13885_TR7420_c0_g1_i1.p1 gnl/Spiro4/13885_TR7420_c0_g1~~gnl/Spiro4/13885_TR7420_c0_g1_i1.p1  ORF type:complete len:196 (+),score=49.35 gnl/Spiro4/13885_TR7420_c0_g1_i1:125-712(+)